MKTFAIIPAAGQGRRFGGPKQFILLHGTPLFLYAVRTFQKSPLIDGICLLVPEGTEGEVHQLIHNEALTKVTSLLAGGQERQDSVKRGFDAIEPCDFIMVHDGVRPFVSQGLIKDVLRGAEKYGGCVAGWPLKETIKRVSPEGRVVETVDRSSLWGIQTPQSFRYDLFQKALKAAEGVAFQGTDEAMLVERVGHPVHVLRGHPFNIKITTPEDLKLAECLLKQLDFQ